MRRGSAGTWDEPLQGIPLATSAALALEAAAEQLEPGKALGTFAILVAAITTDSGSGWETIQLRSQFIDSAAGPSFQDAAIGPGGKWRETRLTPEATEALSTAAALAKSYDLLPLPVGLLVLGVVSRPQAGATRALLAHAELTHADLLALVQDELLGTQLEGLEIPATTEPPARGVDETTTGRGLGPQLPPLTAADLPSDDPVLGPLAEGADGVRRRQGAWLLSRGDRLLEAHDLRWLDEQARKRAVAEASIQLAFGEIPGLVPAIAVNEKGDWLIVETPQLGEDLQQHLSAGGLLGARWPATFYADQIAQVAKTLQALHARGLVHRRVEPANLVFDAGKDRLMVAGFAIGTLEDDSEISRYRAPESYAGETGPALDQYALAVTAQDVFTSPDAPPLTKPVHRVLRRATEARPEDRFPDIDAFGTALRTAIAAEPPRTLAERVAGLSPAKRAALAPAAIGALAALVVTTAVAPGASETAELLPITTLLTVGLTTAIPFALVALAGALRGQRRRLSLRPASNPLLQFALFALLVSLAWHGVDNINTLGTVIRSLIFAYGACALLAPARPAAGTWLQLPLVLWDRRRAWPGWLRKTAPVALVVVAIGALAAPSLAKVGWNDFEFPIEKATEFGPLAPIWNLRTSLAANRTGVVCRDVMTVAASRDEGLCRKVAHIAAGVQAGDPIAKTRLDFGAKGKLDAFGVQELPSIQNHRLWMLLTPDHREAGVIYTRGPNDRDLIAMLTRTAPMPVAAEAMRSTWLYEIVWNGTEWRVAEYRACEIGAPGTGKKPADCVIASTVSAAELKTALASLHKEGQ